MTMATKARISVNLPASLKTAAESYAWRDGVSLDQLIATALAEKVGVQGAAAFAAEKSARWFGGNNDRFFFVRRRTRLHTIRMHGF